MSNFWSGLGDFFTPSSVKDADLARQQKLLELQKQRMGLLGAVNQGNSTSLLSGGMYTDPQTMQTSYRGPEMGGSQALFNNAPLPAPGTGGQAPNLVEPLMGSQVPQNQQRYQQLLSQADPEAALKTQQGLMAQQRQLAMLRNSGLPPEMQQSVVAGIFSPDLGKALSENFKTPDEAKNINAALQGLATAKPGTDAYAAYKAKIDALSIPAQTLAETIRANKAREVNENLSVSTDPNTGAPIIIDKRAGTMTAPTQQGAQPGPQLSYDDPYIKTLPAQVQAKFAQLAPQMQAVIGPMLQGKISPPEGGRAITDPKTLNLLRVASSVDPNFNEQIWRERNKMAVGEASTDPNSFGGRIGAAKKLINHATDYLDSMAELNNPGGKMRNFIGNEMENAMGEGPGVANLNAVRQAREGVGDEFIKLMSGGQGAEGSKEEMRRNLSENNSLSGAVGSVAKVIDLMEGQVKPLADQYNKINNTNFPPEHFLGEEAQAKITALKQLQANAQQGVPITKESIKAAISGKGSLPPGMVKQVGTYKGKPVYVDAKGVKHVDMGQ